MPYSVRKNKTFNVSDDAKARIQDRNTLKRMWQRCKNPSTKKLIKTLINRTNKGIDKVVFSDHNSNFTQMLSKLRTGDKKFWRITKAISGKHGKCVSLIQDGDNFLFTDAEKANAVSSSFERSHSFTANYKHSIDIEVNRFNKRLLENDQSILDASTYTTPNEIKAIIKKLKSFKAPGFDKVQNILFKKLPPRAIILITKILNGCFKITYFLSTFKTTKVIPIDKPGKDLKSPSSYRPISLLSCLGKLLEKIIYARLNAFTTDNNIITREQFGFRAQHSTTHQIKRVVNLVKCNKRKRRSTGMVLLDIEKAFDTVWHNGLVYKLSLYGVPIYIAQKK